MFAALTGAGLSAAAGLNAYIPFLLVALLARFTDVINLPPAYHWIESPWAIGIGVLLLVSELVLDKIPAVDSVNDLVGTAIRPATGGLIGAATQSAGTLDHSSFMQQHVWIGAVGGLVIAGLVHGAKSAARPVANIASFGVAAPILSTVEDTASMGLSLIAVFLPVLVILALIALACASWTIIRRVRTYARNQRYVENLP
ncbi:DUF4126 domain-containing protein [Leekyejoonella antrihumi]|uniref:DUF4126 domain-containing protein n=1 Tax=Leekyejoonella antrihumi TaxID=1660198 RepID=A0A563E8V8_9MICO|nr:DUF4126 domain-containing protein [Leekyejoonella antrihumi]TWP38652.1 DUF4126 domain-containing protein [Leekyejoonella antrihumi]